MGSQFSRAGFIKKIETEAQTNGKSVKKISDTQSEGDCGKM